MKPLTCKEIRNKWIEYFNQKCPSKHPHLKSGSLVPDNPTLLLNAAGMVQFVPFFLGIKEAPEPPRAITIQKCVRVGGKDSDLDNIGRTARHHSFFEMLGNFSFGDYFKAEVIPWAWEFVTRELELDKEKLTISVFAGDEGYAFDQEAYDIWIDVLTKDGIKNPESKIQRMGRADNFWGPPGETGPCGPCSELYYDLGPAYEDPEDRYVEIWNLVFMESEKDAEGNFTPLAKKNIDTGAGLERLATIMQGKENTFETDELFTLIEVISKEVNASEAKQTNPIQYLGKKAQSQEEKDNDLYLKIIADHLRCLAFLIADGVRPSNLGRGYVLRMIIRRAARFAYLLTGNANVFLAKITNAVVESYGEFYPELKVNAQIIQETTQKEEEQFAKTIEKGLEILNQGLKDPKKVSESKILSGDFAFDLYSTYGLPLELSQEIALEKKITVDTEAYNKARDKHSEASNTGAFKVSVVNNKAIPEILKEFGETKFLGYDSTSTKAKVIALLDHAGNRVDQIDATTDTNKIQIILDQTSFYAESGGQLGDKGIVKTENSEIQVLDTKKVEALFIHFASLDSGSIKVGDLITAKVNEEDRRLSKAHHSNCHLLQAALKKVLGNQIQQAGSQVGPEYTRFDFNFDRGMTKEEITKVEDIINGWIQAELPVSAQEMTMDEATKAGALAFFEEKYGDTVRVLTMGDDKETASIELCGGIHVSNTKEIELTKIVSEGSVAAGIRRIKLVTSDIAKEFAKEQIAKEKLEAEQKIAQEKAKAEAKAKKKAMAKQALEMVDSLVDEIQELGGFKVLIKELASLDGDSLKTLTEAIRDKAQAKLGDVILVLATAQEDPETNSKKPIFVVAVSDALSKNTKAGDIAKAAAQICGGGGGGRPNFAQAGGKDASKIAEALENAKQMIAAAKV